MKFKYSNMVLGGTFDCLHIGHKKLIDKAFELAEFVSIGITSDELNRERGKIIWESEAIRKRKLEDYLSSKGFQNRSKIILIDDIYGNSTIDPNLDAIIATKETLPNIEAVNLKRAKNGLKGLDVVMVSHAKDSSGKIISSSRIRNGEISPDGQNYQELLLRIADKKLSKKILNKFKAPLGKIIQHVIPAEAGIHIITIGDITTRKFLEHDITPKLSIIDLKTRRLSVIPRPAGPWESILKAKSLPGSISTSLILAINKSIRKSGGSLVVVNGEEDLATIPAVLLSPFGAKVYYGQPNAGMVQIIVNQESKAKILGKLS